MGGRARRRRSGFRRQRPISRRVFLAVAVCPAVGRPSSPLAAALSDVGVFHVLDLGLRPNEPHRARCRSSAFTSDEHVWLCASRAGRQRPRRLRFQSDTTSCTERSNGDQENQQRFALRGRSLSPGRCRAISSTRAPPPTPTSPISIRPTAPRSSPLLAGELRIIRAELTIGREGRPALAGFACAVNPGVLSGLPGAGG